MKKAAIVGAGVLMLSVSVPAFGRGATAVEPTGNPGTWITSDDYPATALHDNISGMVSFALTVGPDGLPSECKVTGTSGSSVA